MTGVCVCECVRRCVRATGGETDPTDGETPLLRGVVGVDDTAL